MFYVYLYYLFMFCITVLYYCFIVIVYIYILCFFVIIFYETLRGAACPRPDSEASGREREANREKQRNNAANEKI